MQVMAKVEQGGGKTERGSMWYRSAAALVGGVCLTLVVIALKVEPAAAGYGSHEQLDLPRCGFLERTGYPCPTCGMTTAFAHVVRGQFGRAIAAQPVGALLAVICVTLMGVSFHAAVSGKRYNLAGLVFYINRIIIGGAMIFLAGWGWMCLRIWLKHGM